MIPHLLADSQVPYTWPETNLYTLIQLFFVLFLFLLIFLVTKYIFQREKNTHTTWTNILHFSYNKKLTTKEVSIIEHFFNTVDLSMDEKANLVRDKKSFHNHLYSYLKQYHSESVENYVRILDKLFPLQENNLEIKSILDVLVGEACAIEFDGLYFLAKVISKTETDVLLSISDPAIRKEHESLNINLYFYRESFGGCLIPGVVKKITNNGILFSQEGDIQPKGEEHLVAELTRAMELAPWDLSLDSSMSHPVLEESSTLTTQEAEDDLNELKPNGKDIPEDSTGKIQGVIVKLSDRAALINVRDPFFNSALLRKIDIWEMTVSLSPGAIPLVLKGKIMHSDSFSESYIFKFIALSDSDTHQIFEEIKKHSPVRGFIS